MSPALQTAPDGGILTGMDVSTQPGAAGDTSAAWPSPGVPSGCEATLCTVAHTSAAEPVLADAQRRWAARPIVERLVPIRQARHWMAAHPEVFVKAISRDLARSEADTLVAELLPLLEAMRFLERNARKVLAPRKLGSAGRPLWLAGVQAEIHHDPLGHVLVIGPANFPLFLPGAQVLQALIAGNAVTWKPGTGGRNVAVLLTHVLREAGLPRGILHVTDESVDAAQQALAQTPDKVIFTGSYDTGRNILRRLADTATPATMELSGADAVVLLPSADLRLAAQAIAFGLRLNGAEVCMSPRRLIAARETLQQIRPLLHEELAKIPGVALKPRTAEALHDAVRDAVQQGATIAGEFRPAAQQPLLIDRATASMAVTSTDLFAPVLSLMEEPSVLHMADLVNNSSYALTAAIFGNSDEAKSLAVQLRAGTVLINDLIAPTADPRVPFGGRGHSGFGTTRGAEGLLEMTATKTVLLRRKGNSRHYAPLSDKDTPMFAGLIGALHGGSLAGRWTACKQLIAAARQTTRK